MTEAGPDTVEVPRDRAGTFMPKVLPKNARRTEDLDDLVMSLTAGGLTSRRWSRRWLRFMALQRVRRPAPRHRPGRGRHGGAGRCTRSTRLLVDVVNIKIRNGQGRQPARLVVLALLPAAATTSRACEPLPALGRQVLASVFHHAIVDR